MDREVERLCRERYPETEILRQVKGVGPITALCFVLTLEDPSRFRRSRSVGAYLGLRPRQRDSGDLRPQLRITKAGDELLRRLLVGAAQHILGPFGKDSDLRRFGLRLAAQGGSHAKKRAVVAVAPPMESSITASERNSVPLDSPPLTEAVNSRMSSLPGPNWPGQETVSPRRVPPSVAETKVMPAGTVALRPSAVKALLRLL